MIKLWVNHLPLRKIITVYCFANTVLYANEHKIMLPCMGPLKSKKSFTHFTDIITVENYWVKKIYIEPKSWKLNQETDYKKCFMDNVGTIKVKFSGRDWLRYAETEKVSVFSCHFYRSFFSKMIYFYSLFIYVYPSRDETDWLPGLWLLHFFPKIIHKIFFMISFWLS